MLQVLSKTTYHFPQAIFLPSRWIKNSYFVFGSQKWYDKNR